MDDDTQLAFSLPAVCRKKVTAAFNGGTISSDGGVVLLAAAERRLGLMEHMAALIPDHRDPTRLVMEIEQLIAGGAADVDTVRPTG
jgi:hypothetical protein